MSIVGRGENRTVEILKHIFPKNTIYQQYPLRNLISPDEYKRLGPEYNKHNHDIVMFDSRGFCTVIEVDFEHGDIAQEKWELYEKLLHKFKHKTCNIPDSECKSLFQLKDGKHTDTWQDWIDVINALKTAGVDIV